MTEKIYRILLDEISSQMALVDDLGVIRYCNRAFSIFTGLRAAGDAEGRNLFEVLPFVENEISVLKDTIRSVAVSREPAPEARVIYHLKTRNETVKLDRRIFPVPSKQGDNYFTCLILESCIEDGAQTQLGREGNLEEIDKKAALGNLLWGFGHEIKTPLGAIICNTDLMSRCVGKINDLFEQGEERKFLESHKPLGDHLKMLKDSMEVNQVASKQIVHRIQSLKEFVKADKEKKSEIDLNDILENARVLINHLIRGRIILKLNYGDIRKTSGYPGKLYQIFLNILLNAVEAIKEKGVITVTTGNQDDRVFVSIHDTGEGIPEEHLDRIFHQGFTTKQCGGGTGLGLYISRNIIHEHGGTIEIESEAGKGTTFRIFLPSNPGDSGA